MSGTARRPHISDAFTLQRRRMVEFLHDVQGIRDPRVLDAMGRLPRHLFVPEALRSQAYRNNALPIAGGQTISQPFIVARMTELLELKGREKVLEIGSGTGYQTAILAELSRSVFAVERLPQLAADARERLKRLGIYNVSLKLDDGTAGWKMYAPYEAILVAAGSPDIPMPLVEQLKTGGRLVIPVGADQRSQELVMVVRTQNGVERRNCGPCAFVPLIGEHGWQAN